MSKSTKKWQLVYDMLNYAHLYAVCPTGRIGRMDEYGAYTCLPLRDDGRGYLCVSLKQRNGNWVTKKVHRLMWETFNGDIPKGYHVDHINHAKADNRLSNARRTSEVRRLTRIGKS